MCPANTSDGQGVQLLWYEGNAVFDWVFHPTELRYGDIEQLVVLTSGDVERPAEQHFATAQVDSVFQVLQVDVHEPGFQLRGGNRSTQ